MVDRGKDEHKINHVMQVTYIQTPLPRSIIGVILNIL